MKKIFYVMNTPKHLQKSNPDVPYYEWPNHYYVVFEKFVSFDWPEQHKTTWCCACPKGPFCSVKPIYSAIDERQ